MTGRHDGGQAHKGAGRFTGRHMAAILVTFFGIVIAVNLTMARLASSTFGGKVVENSYVASQKFNGWLEKAREEEALGWTLDLARTPGQRLDVTLHEAASAMTDARITALVRHPLGRAPERTMQFRHIGGGRYQSVGALPAGRWIIHVRAQAHGRELNRIVDLS
ncbi:nitrogen fixation protein FixH [Sphingobium sp. SYK-6]|uniref:FixH family protein n=1 Tax=Sphingobium sp. (strain NBRC 103272 / SYK-6) TaxID=627192 RepID=UPI0002277FD9|nr:FixH family protein [Sphingobium sp. SYK-6]BAK68510.1 nitrogen fixation protein FixH [Sphingobium sp. SYK-6]